MVLFSFFKYFGAQMSLPDTFSYSNGWLVNFKRRKNISSIKLHGEAASADMASVAAGREQLQEDLKAYSLDDIYNMDETGLFYRLKPNQTLAAKSATKQKGTKISKERVTVALCSNATGSDKRRPLLIGKSAKPRAFKNFDASFYVKYRNNKKAWMTSPLFLEWVESLNDEMKNEGRHIALVIDNASSHGKETQWSNVTIFFLPPNTTAHTQPMDAGIIRNFKCNYRRHTTRKHIEQIEADQTPLVDMADCVRFVSRAWNEVTPNTIQNCWRHTKILPPSQETQVSTATASDAEAAEAQLSSLLESAPSFEHVSASDFIECDSELPVGDDPSDEEIIAICSPEEEVSSPDAQSPAADDHSEPEEQPQPPVTSREALDALHVLQRYWEQQGPKHTTHMEAIQSMMSATMDLQHKKAVQFSMKHFFKPAHK